MREMKGDPGEVERLKYENRILKTELQKVKVHN